MRRNYPEDEENLIYQEHDEADEEFEASANAELDALSDEDEEDDFESGGEDDDDVLALDDDEADY